MQIKVFLTLLAWSILCATPLTAQDTASQDLSFFETAEESNTEKNLPQNVIIDPNFLNDNVKAYDDYAKVIVRILDKITAESRTFDLNIGKTVAFGSLRIRPMTCKKSPPIEEPESASFLQIWEKTPEMKDEWVFSGWMFASSPSLSAMEHPVYDVWVVDCKD